MPITISLGRERYRSVSVDLLRFSAAKDFKITSQVYERLAAEYIFEPRKVDLKGKGTIETYVLINPR